MNKVYDIIKRLLFFVVMIGILSVFTGCGSANVDTSENAEKNSDSITSGTESGSGSDTVHKIDFIDDDGVQIQMEKAAERIISLYSAHTENLYYLGAGDKLIGNYKTGTWPSDAAFLPMYDYSADPESVIAASPDLVVIRPFISKKAPDFVETLKNSGITVVSLYPDKFEEFDNYINKLALISGTEKNAEELLLRFHSDIDEISEKTENIADKQTIFFESTETMVRTITPDSMAGLAINFAGGINIAADAKPIEVGSSIAAFGEENVLKNADKIDVYISQRGSMNSGANWQGISERAGFDAVKAIKDGRFYTVNEKIISSPSFRYVKGVREIARYLYPDVMDNAKAYGSDERVTRRLFADIVFEYLHLPVYIPSSSSYYTTEHDGHTFGLFEDVDWQDPDFDAIEAVCERGYLESVKDNGKEYFDPDGGVTRDDLAQAIFLMGDFRSNDTHIRVSDLDESEHQRIVQILVDNGIFTLNDAAFEPKREVSANEVLEVLDNMKSVS